MISYVAAGGGVWAIMGIAGSFASPPSAVSALLGWDD